MGLWQNKIKKYAWKSPFCQNVIHQGSRMNFKSNKLARYLKGFLLFKPSGIYIFAPFIELWVQFI